MNWAKIGLFAGGALFGSAGIELLTSKDAKKVYTQCTAAVLRMKDQVMKTATSLQENCGDILAAAKEINEQRAAEDAPPLYPPLLWPPPTRPPSNFIHTTANAADAM